jgi:Holliday junction resolvase-like predicted endonuclease
MSFPRRQRYNRLWRGVCSAGLAVVLVIVGFLVASAGAASAGVLLVLVAAGVGLYARYWFSLARRSRVGARSERLVRRELAALQREGWRVRHSRRWPRGGDIDSVAIAPTGLAVAIETKTRVYEARHLDRVRAQAEWLERRRGRWTRRRGLAVLCVVRERGVEDLKRGVLIVSIDRLNQALQAAAGLSERNQSAARLWRPSTRRLGRVPGAPSRWA